MQKEINKLQSVRKVYETYWDSYIKGDLKTFASTLDEKFEMIGTSETEVCHSKADGIAFFKAQMHEVVGKTEMRNRQINVLSAENLMLVNEQCDIYVLVDSDLPADRHGLSGDGQNQSADRQDWNFYSKIRISTFLRETESGWKVTQQHGSLPDMRVHEGETLAIEKISKENLELRDAVKRRTAELENKNRELAIEAALEKVRALTMAMHSSDDVGKCIVKMFSELTAFGVDEGTRFGIGILNHDNENNQLWTARKNGDEVNMHIGNIDMASHPLLKSARKAWKEQVSFHRYLLEGEDLLNYYQMLNNAPDYKIQIPLEKLPEREIQHCFIFEHGFFYAFSPREFQPELIHITKRFSSLFEQTYRRYLDLVKAEAQTREAEIQLALERVRARSLAMHRSEELADISLELVRQVQTLGMESWFCAFNIYDDDPQGSMEWGSNGQGTFPTYRTPREGVFLRYFEAGQKGETFLVNEIGEEACPAHYEYLCTLPGVGEQLLQMKAAGIPFPTSQIDHVAFFKYGYVLFITYEPAPESHDIFKRFANVFEQSYTRFLDLQKAEAQVLEVTKQTSLDRVRGVISNMRNADDLNRITPLVFNELTTLGIPFIRCGVFIVHEMRKNVEVYLSTPEGKSLAVMNLPFDSNEMTARSVEAWKKGQVYVQHWNQRDFVNWGKSMQEQGYVIDLKTYQGADTAPESLHLHFVPFSQGLLYIGSTETLAEEQIDLVKALAKSFAIAYARYEDFVKLEQAKAEVESAMSELKATQSQLVQQEKLASLGQLTAGIAHEIKNPLNFVNNFSEVSIEMIEEVIEELEKPLLPIGQNQNPPSGQVVPKPNIPASRDEILIKENLEDIKANLKKIHDHGSRANGIVTSMLQHSRGGSSKMEPTDLNALIKEYVNLSFHGMRAGKNPINVDIVLDLDPELGEVSLIKEDFTRVVINLCNNAFDACTERSRSERSRSERSRSACAERSRSACAERSRSTMNEKAKRYHPDGYREQSTKYQEEIHSEVNYVPKLRVSTILENGKVRISFEDNGPGIPDEIKDKILQPFFTTKKGTEGTGLGLSITHDIVKAHGGELRMETLMNKGTIFIIQLSR